MKTQISQARNGKDLYRVAYSYERRLKKMEEELKFLKNLLDHDELTGLWNRRVFDSALMEAINSKNKERKDFSILILDLNHFGELNKKHGHLYGNNKLIEFAANLNEVVRNTDIVSRFGGDEFAVLLRNVNLVEVVNIINRLIDKSAISFSGGVYWSYVDNLFADHKDIFNCADEVLRRIKKERDTLNKQTIGKFLNENKFGVQFGIYA